MFIFRPHEAVGSGVTHDSILGKDERALSSPWETMWYRGFKPRSLAYKACTEVSLLVFKINTNILSSYLSADHSSHSKELWWMQKILVALCFCLLESHIQQPSGLTPPLLSGVMWPLAELGGHLAYEGWNLVWQHVRQIPYPRYYHFGYSGFLCVSRDWAYLVKRNPNKYCQIKQKLICVLGHYFFSQMRESWLRSLLVSCTYKVYYFMVCILTLI